MSVLREKVVQNVHQRLAVRVGQSNITVGESDLTVSKYLQSIHQSLAVQYCLVNVGRLSCICGDDVVQWGRVIRC